MITKKSIEKAEKELFHYNYEYDQYIELPIIDFYINYFKKE